MLTRSIQQIRLRGILPRGLTIYNDSGPSGGRVAGINVVALKLHQIGLSAAGDEGGFRRFRRGPRIRDQILLKAVLVFLHLRSEVGFST